MRQRRLQKRSINKMYYCHYYINFLSNVFFFLICTEHAIVTRLQVRPKLFIKLHAVHLAAWILFFAGDVFHQTLTLYLREITYDLHY